MKNIKNIFAILAIAIAAILLPACNKTSEGGAASNGIIDTTLPDGTIKLTSCAGGIYFGDFWD